MAGEDCGRDQTVIRRSCCAVWMETGIRMFQQLALEELYDIALAVHILAWTVNYSIRFKP
jgi:hypothetical protein